MTRSEGCVVTPGWQDHHVEYGSRRKVGAMKGWRGNTSIWDDLLAGLEKMLTGNYDAGGWGEKEQPLLFEMKTERYEECR